MEQLFKNQKLYGSFSLVIFIVAAIFSKGYHHFDEHFQILEFAFSKLGYAAIETLPWEHAQQMRPAIQPFIVIGIYKLASFFSEPNPFFISLILRLITALFSFYIISSLYSIFIPRIKYDTLKSWYFFLTFFLWFQVYVGVRFSSETWSANFFLLAFVFYNKKPVGNLLNSLLVGILFGASFIFRFQAAFLIVGYITWMFFIDREKIRNILIMIMGGVSMLLVGYLIDSWYYGESTISYLNYFQQYMLEDEVSGFGTHPCWYYLWRFFILGIPPLSLLFILAVFIFLYKNWKHSISWIITPFILIHFIIGHKELRFLFPLISFLPIILIYAMEHFYANLRESGLFKLLFRLSVIINVIFLTIVSFRFADPQIPLYESLYSNYTEPTVLYHLGKNPYHRITEIEFYKRGNLEIKEISSINEIKEESSKIELLVVDQKANLPFEFIQNSNLVYSTFPKWVLKFNFNNWQKRTMSWKVYEVGS